MRARVGCTEETRERGSILRSTGHRLTHVPEPPPHTRLGDRRRGDRGAEALLPAHRRLAAGAERGPRGAALAAAVARDQPAHPPLALSGYTARPWPVSASN